ncbi:19160_t:CDS:1 [Dentiscutata erythropus]|uniref:19160_t:CDS:1 n=1 Tax=Dentiscutata erythropus TaxID=1348616 RepID=A0A9N8VCG9_9GLOM|nr:19160_t:CDS:1 [Dentiscutata erythropus]
MGNIPLFCPADYNYTLPIIRTACMVRISNLLCMWTAILFSFLSCCCGMLSASDDGDNSQYSPNHQNETDTSHQNEINTNPTFIYYEIFTFVSFRQNRNLGGYYA